jgi:hypothetical protein
MERHGLKTAVRDRSDKKPSAVLSPMAFLVGVSARETHPHLTRRMS